MAERAITMPFSFDSSGAISYSRDIRKIWQDRVVMVIMTRLRERIMRPAFGSEVHEYVFETEQAAATEIKGAISVAFSKWLPSLQLLEVEVSKDQLDGYLVVDVFYKYDPKVEGQSVKIKTAILTRSGDTILEVNS